MGSNFKDREILGYTYIDGVKVTVLKMGVKRKHYNDNLEPDELEPHINQQLVDLKKWEKYYKQVVGLDDFEN